MPDVQFEEIREEHIKLVLDIYNHYVLYTTVTWQVEEQTPEGMREIVFFKKDKYRTFVILDGSTVCGYVLVSEYKKREAWGGTAEVSVYINPDYTGHGIGRKALKYIEDYSKKTGIHVLLAVISGDNDRSISLFERCGYLKCGHLREVGIKFGKVLDAVIYQKIL